MGVFMTDQDPKKEAYKEKFKAQLHVWQAEIDKMKAKAEKAEADAKIEYQKQLDKLRDMQDEAWEDFEKLRNAGERAWDEIKVETEKNWLKMNNTIKEAIDKIK